MDHVLVDLPFVHRIEARRPRRRTVESFVAVSTVPVRIRVAGWGEGSRFEIRGGRRAGDDGKVDGIVLDGTAYVDVADRTGGLLGRDLGDPRFFSVWARDGTGRVAPDLVRVVLRAVHGDPADDARISDLGILPELAAVLSSDEDEAASRAVRTAKGLVYHAGRLASSHLEPVLTIADAGPERNRAPSLFAADVRKPLQMGPFLSMDAVRGLPDVDAPVGVPEGVVWRMPDAEVATARAWDRTLRSLQGSSMGDVRADAALVRAVASGARRGRLPRGEVEDACDALERIARSRIRAAGEFSGNGLDEVLSMIDRTRGLIAAREPDMGFAAIPS